MDNPAFDPCGESLPNPSDTAEVDAGRKEGIELKRKMGLTGAVNFIVCNMIGSGIFISPGRVIQGAGSVGLSLVFWALAGLLVIFASLSNAELGVLIPKSGGEHAYFSQGFRRFHPFWGPLPAFLYAWLVILLLRPVSSAVTCLAIAGYTLRPILGALHLHDDGCWSTDNLMKMVAILYLGLECAINCYSVKWALRICSVVTAAKLAAVAILIGCGLYKLAVGINFDFKIFSVIIVVILWQGETEYLAEGFQGTEKDFGIAATGFYGALWAYDGW